MTVFTTLNKIRSNSPCHSGWTKLLAYLGKTKADDEPVSLVTILESNGLSDAIWCLRAVSGYEREVRLFTVACARQVQHLMTDNRSIDALDVAERFAKGEATREELDAARTAAAHAARTAAARATYYIASYIASYTAYYAAYCATYYAALDAACSADAADVAYVADAAYAADAADARTKQADLFREFFD